MSSLFGLEQMNDINSWCCSKTGQFVSLPEGVVVQWPVGTRTFQCEKNPGGHWLLGGRPLGQGKPTGAQLCSTIIGRWWFFRLTGGLRGAWGTTGRTREVATQAGEHCSPDSLEGAPSLVVIAQRSQGPSGGGCPQVLPPNGCSAQ